MRQFFDRVLNHLQFFAICVNKGVTQTLILVFVDFAQFVRQLVAYELVRKYTVELSGEPKKYGFANIVPLPTGKVIMKLTARANDCAVADRKDDHEADSEEKPNEPAVAKE